MKNYHIMGFENVTTSYLLIHLYLTYDKISEKVYADTNYTMKELYDPKEPIEGFFDLIKTAMDISDVVERPYTPSQVLETSYNMIYQMGWYIDPFREWKNKTSSDKTWDSFKEDFSISHHDLQETHSPHNNMGTPTIWIIQWRP